MHSIFNLRSVIMQCIARLTINRSYHPTLIWIACTLNHLDMLDVTTLEHSRQDLDQMWIIEHLAPNPRQGVYKEMKLLEHLLAISLSLDQEKLTFSLVADVTLSLRYIPSCIKICLRTVRARIRVKVRIRVIGLVSVRVLGLRLGLGLRF